MKTNINLADKTLRLAGAIGLIVSGVYINMPTGLEYTLFGLAGVLFLTAFLNFCPLYALLGISTNAKTNLSKK